MSDSETEDSQMDVEKEDDDDEVQVIASLPEKSRATYESAYAKFESWCQKKDVKEIDENIMLAYFSQECATRKPSSTWSHYSMIKASIHLKKNVNIGKFIRLTMMLKRKAVGYKPKRSKILTRADIERFLREADDETYLAIKVALILGVMGSCCREKFTKMTMAHIEDRGSLINVLLPDPKNKACRYFTVTEGDLTGVNMVEIIRKYISLRPPKTEHMRLFLGYRGGKCVSQPIGINTFGDFPKRIATFLQLPNPELYTGHCFRRSSMPFLESCGPGRSAPPKRYELRPGNCDVKNGYADSSFQTYAAPLSVPDPLEPKHFDEWNDGESYADNSFLTESSADTSTHKHEGWSINGVGNGYVENSFKNKLVELSNQLRDVHPTPSTSKNGTGGLTTNFKAEPDTEEAPFVEKGVSFSFTVPPNSHGNDTNTPIQYNYTNCTFNIYMNK